MQAQTKPIAKYRRRASVYMVVLGTAMVVAVLGMSALIAQRISLRTNNNRADLAAAKLLVRSGLESAIDYISDDSDWRSNILSGNVVPCYSGDTSGTCTVNPGTFKVTAVDPLDDDISDSPDDSIVLTATGTIGNARQLAKVSMVTNYQPLSCLDAVFASGGSLTFRSAHFAGDQVVASNDAISANADGGSDSTVNADVEAVNTISGRYYYGSTTSGVSSREMPDSSTAFTYYVENSKTLTLSDLDFDGTWYRLDNAVLGDPDGNAEDFIFALDCQNNNVALFNTVVHGTIVLQNAAWVHLDRSVHLDALADNYPAILIDGDTWLDLVWSNVDTGQLGSGLKWQGKGKGQGSLNIKSEYQVGIHGLVYITGYLYCMETTTLEGVMLVAGQAMLSGQQNFTYSSAYYDDPPPGFRNIVGMKMVAGSWRQVVE